MNIFNGVNAPRGDHRNPDRPRQTRRRLDIDALKHAIATDVGVDDGFDAIVFKLLREVNDVMIGKLGPAINGHLAVFCIETHDDVIRKLGSHLTHEVRGADGFGPDDDVIDPGIQIGLNGVFITNTPADLNLHVRVGLTN